MQSNVYLPMGRPLPLPPLASSAKVSGASLLHTRTTQFNSNRTSVVRSGRQKYERLYPVMLIQTDGSTVNIRYKEPKRMLMVSENEREKPLLLKKTVKPSAAHFEDDFSINKYRHFWMKK
uniref:Mitochondrial ribosomal protein L55 n=1 Tax=Mola mola TaxID=94237 RepID=A0A3Q3WQM4_MOLML